MQTPFVIRVVALAFTFISLGSSYRELAHCQESELRKGASGSGEILTNESKTIARRRTRPAKPKQNTGSATLNTAVDYFTKGSEHFDNGQYDQAAKAFEHAIKLDPKYQEAYYALGDAYLKLNKEDKVLEADRQGLEIAQSTKTLVHAGVMNGKALNFQTPATPPMARAIRASGSVKVQIIVDENGNVMTASAIEGHPLLKHAAVNAAMQVKFAPFTLRDKPSKVSGVLVYEFS
jgi:TonB family protein